MIEKDQWRYVFASVAGTSHADGGTPCQDTSLIVDAGEGVSHSLILVASDGAGSAPRAELGSSMACSLLVGQFNIYLRRGNPIASLTRETVVEWLRLIVEDFEKRAYSDRGDVRDMACTLVAAVVTSNEAAFLQIGDGVIVTDKGGSYAPVFWPQSGGYANTTFFITDEDAAQNLQFTLATTPVEEIALLTDGLQMLALRYASKEVHVPFFVPLFERLRREDQGESLGLRDELVAWLTSSQVNERTDDDKTLLLATRRTHLRGDGLAPHIRGCT